MQNNDYGMGLNWGDREIIHKNDKNNNRGKGNIIINKLLMSGSIE